MSRTLFKLERAIVVLRHIYGKLANGKTLPQVCNGITNLKRPYYLTYMRAAKCILLVAAGIGLGVIGAGAEDVAQGIALRVAVKPIAPFVLKHGTELSGFSIDLWTALAQSLKVDNAWVEVTTVGDQLQAVKSGKADAAIAAITITKERESVVDFTQPYFDSGLQVMVHAQGGNHLLDVFDSIPWRTIATLLGAFVAIMFVMANVL